ncbi:MULTISPECIES: hypothetical protein [Chryseobacterium]|jgi:hypothetical protein|uniref:Uncharacterized protein n=1 Tax=Chryseobacterium rhizosphaerae TaxID=395937 RepID=A0ABX9INE9_9FLAO|nr:MULTISPECIES: hypothetical protein [Chryseobacterium]MDC8099393.1 hypothetical protein [Chryseobacterium rhizosphaerae]REC76924.1 hypothetical protein DRF57_05925 [Chryseobacterium rhizosphaerae]GEN66424.1 hypothetical protein CRH01_09920 [Chryseobacterium rhizosphaerae]SMC96435.1 hypothetical protein SAMN02787074_4079 [Chryseobacterium sp. YR221]
MKEFTKNDYYIQVFFIIAGIVISIAGMNYWGFMAFYFVVGISQLISFLIRLFIKSKKTMAYIIYGIAILPVWISLLMIVLLSHDNSSTNFFGYILIGALLYSPVMAGLYVYDCYKTYQFYK